MVGLALQPEAGLLWHDRVKHGPEKVRKEHPPQSPGPGVHGQGTQQSLQPQAGNRNHPDPSRPYTQGLAAAANHPQSAGSTATLDFGQGVVVVGGPDVAVGQRCEICYQSGPVWVWERRMDPPLPWMLEGTAWEVARCHLAMPRQGSAAHLLCPCGLGSSGQVSVSPSGW